MGASVSCSQPPSVPSALSQTVRSKDGAAHYTVFDKCAVRISVEESVGGRRSLVLRLVPREELPASEQMH